MHKLCLYILTLACVVLFHAPVHATIIDAATLLHDFNVITFNNATSNSDVEGAAIIGGYFSGATVYNNPKGVALPTSFGALNVYGNTQGNPININNGGNAYVGGSKGAIVNFNGGGKYVASPTLSIASIQSEFYSLSNSLSGLTANSFLPTTGNNEVIKANPNSNGVAIFDITANQLSAIPSYSFNLNGASTVIINVSGSNLNFSANYEGDDSSDDHILWNFYQANNLNFNSLIGGSILAPYAEVTNNNQIDGTLIASSWAGQGELHEYSFDGSFPTQTPEPNTILLFTLGLVTLGLLSRRFV